jgi:hypothetical protein
MEKNPLLDHLIEGINITNKNKIRASELVIKILNQSKDCFDTIMISDVCFAMAKILAEKAEEQFIGFGKFDEEKMKQDSKSRPQKYKNIATGRVVFASKCSRIYIKTRIPGNLTEEPKFFGIEADDRRIYQISALILKTSCHAQGAFYIITDVDGYRYISIADVFESEYRKLDAKEWEVSYGKK